MVTSCCAIGCTYRHVKGSPIVMYRIPKNEIVRKLWVQAIKRDNWKPTASSRICGQHFPTGKISFLMLLIVP